MSPNNVTLRSFTDDELIFDEAETRDILKFFFPAEISRIESAKIDSRLRCFAQGLLVEAVDASYAMGYVKILFDLYYRPDLKLGSAIRTLGRKAAMHWFKHARQKDLLKAKVYESVRAALSWKFRTDLIMIIDGLAESSRPVQAFVRYNPPRQNEIIWG